MKLNYTNSIVAVMALSAAFSFSSCENIESLPVLEENQEQQKRVVTIQITLPKQDTRVVIDDTYQIRGWKECLVLK